MKLDRTSVVCGLVAVLCLGAGSLLAQEKTGTATDAQGQGKDGNAAARRTRGNFDPATFQQRMMDGVKDRLGFTNDAVWTAVQPLVQKVFDARREVGIPGMGFGGGGRGGNGAAGTDSNNPRRNAFSAPNPDADALQKAIDDHAPAAQVKTMLDKYRASRTDKQAKLEAAQENLRKVLTARQEAQAVLMGLLN